MTSPTSLASSSEAHTLLLYLKELASVPIIPPNKGFTINCTWVSVGFENTQQGSSFQPFYTKSAPESVKNEVGRAGRSASSGGVHCFAFCGEEEPSMSEVQGAPI